MLPALAKFGRRNLRRFSSTAPPLTQETFSILSQSGCSVENKYYKAYKPKRESARTASRGAHVTYAPIVKLAAELDPDKQLGGGEWQPIFVVTPLLVLGNTGFDIARCAQEKICGSCVSS